MKYVSLKMINTKITNTKIYKIIKYNFCAYDSNDTSIQCQLPRRGIQ